MEGDRVPLVPMERWKRERGEQGMGGVGCLEWLESKRGLLLIIKINYLINN